ncbi:hypothetical protein BDV12DRAFT_197830 [Aspergillus spectabilis]
MTVLEHEEKPDPVHIEYRNQDHTHDDSIEDIATSWFVWLVAFTASIAGNDLDGRLHRTYGRKPAIYVGCVLFTVGAVLQGAAYSIAQLSVGRLVVGFGVGSASMVVLLYIAEIAPTKARGHLIGLNNMSITGGQVISYGLGAAFAHVSSGWRYMVGLGAVPSIILACLLPFCPESPRQLIYHDEQTLSKIRLIAGCDDESKELNKDSTRWAKIKMLHTKPAYSRTLVCACGFIVISQMSGFNTVMYYSATLFDLWTNFIMTWVNMMAVDPIGRCRIVLLTSWGMCAGLVTVAIAFSFISANASTLGLKTDSVSPAAIVVLVFIIWLVFFYGVSMGNTAWMNTDLFPMEVRAVGTMWLSCSCWASNIIVSSTFLSMMKGITPSGAFGFYAAIRRVGYVLIYFFYPEVSGLTLEEIKKVFEHGFGVSFARQLRKERRAIKKAEQAEKAVADGG